MLQIIQTINRYIALTAMNVNFVILSYNQKQLILQACLEPRMLIPIQLF